MLLALGNSHKRQSSFGTGYQACETNTGFSSVGLHAFLFSDAQLRRFIVKKGNNLPEDGFVRLPVVLSVFPVSKAHFYEGIRKGIYPKPVKLSERVAAWKVQDIRELLQRAGS